jgi:Fe2+ or Zn2+ uptake regulation protein
MGTKNQEQSIKKVMKSKGLRITPQRFAVYANLLSRCDHPTVEQILEDINQEIPISSKASVYSALSVLRSCGLVQEVLLEEGVTRFDANVKPHHHFICESCGQIQDLDWQMFNDIPKNLFDHDLQVKTYEVIVKGTCKNCQS